MEWSGGGGLGHYAFLLADALARHGGDVTLITREGYELTHATHAQRVITAWPAAPTGARGVRRGLRIGFARIGGWLRVCRLVSRARKRHPVVHLQSIDQSPEVIFGGILRLLGATLIVTLHNARPHDANARQRLMQNLGMRLPHGFVVHTEAVAQEVRRARPRPASIRALAHPSYRRLAELAAPAAPPREGLLRIGSLGMIRPYKGLEFVVDVVRRLRARGMCIELRVAGRATNPEWVGGLLATLPEGAASSRLEYLPLADLLHEVAQADVLLLGHRSTSESGIAQLALGAGVPVIGPRIGALGRLLEAEPAWLFEPEDHDEAEQRMLAVLAHLGENRDALRRRALAVAESAPSWEEMAEACLDLACETADAAPRRGRSS